MSDLDQIRISQILGSTVRPYNGGGFGAFGVAASTAEMLANRPRPEVKLKQDTQRDQAIVQAFSETHQGFAVDRLLADPQLTSKFLRRVKDLGVDAPAVAINKRLLRIRKATDLAVSVPAATKRDKRDLSRFLIAAEVAFALISRTRPVTSDDLLADPAIGLEFDALAQRFAGVGDVIDLRLALLHLRKNIRSRSNSDLQILQSIGTNEVANRWLPLGSLERIDLENIPSSEGVFSIADPNRYLYLTKYSSLREGLSQFKRDKVLESLGNHFWKPNPTSIAVQIIQRHTGDQFPLRIIEAKALDIYRPAFNLLPRAA